MLKMGTLINNTKSTYGNPNELKHCDGANERGQQERCSTPRRALRLLPCFVVHAKHSSRVE
jgi:hypothetical protein